MKFKIIQDNVDVLKLLELLGIEGQMNGNNFIAKCPVNPDHDDKTPSFGVKVIGEGKGVWNCYGCGMKGNLIHLVMYMKNVSRDEATSLISEWFNLDEVIPEVSTKELLKLLEENGEEDEVLVIPLPRLSGNKEKVIEYLMQRRGYNETEAWDICNTYKMDYCDVGYYKGRLIIPVYDSDGVYVTFEAQLVEGEGKKKLYPKGSQISRLLFNDYNIKGSKVVITEGLWDAIRLKMYGYPAISVFGANNLTKYQAYKIIRKYDEVILFFDGDQAGQDAVDKALCDVFYPFVDTHVVYIKGKDPDECSKEETKILLEKSFLDL